MLFTSFHCEEEGGDDVCLTDIRVEVGLSLPSGLAARVLFLCIRQVDCSGDQTRVKGLCVASVGGIKNGLKVGNRLVYSIKHVFPYCVFTQCANYILIYYT